MAAAARVRVATALMLLALAAQSQGCAVPPYGCPKTFCDSLATPPKVRKTQGFDFTRAASWDLRLGYWLGIYNKRYTDAQKQVMLTKRGGPSINYESFSEVGDVVRYHPARSLAACCNACRITNNCWMYQYFDALSSSGRPNPKGFKAGVRCYLLKGGSEKADDLTGRGTPYSGKRSEQIQPGDGYSPLYNPSWVGGMCNGNSSVVDDPHFTGGHGVKFDFNGLLDRSFCLSTDERLHINVLLKGYEDTRTFGATPTGDQGKAIRSWIKEVGLLWSPPSSPSKKHSLRLVARSGKRQDRGADGFLSAVELDGVPLEPPNYPGAAIERDGLRFAFLGTSRTGAYEVDRFSLSVDGLVDMTVSMRVAHPLLQAPDDAEVHFNVVINEMEASEKVHGVLGQTFRSDPSQQVKALMYRLLSRLIGGRIAADGESGKGFLDGQMEDYITTDVMTSDCKFSAFSA